MSKEASRALGVGLLLYFTGGAVGGAFGTALRTIGVSQMLGAAASALTKLPTRRNALNSRGTVIGPQVALPLVFGTCRLPASMAFYDSAGTGKNDLHYALAFAATHAGGCGGVTDIYIDGKRINIATQVTAGEVTSGPFAGFVNVRVYNGVESQGVDSILDAAFASWASTAYGRFLATVAIRFRYVASDDKDFQKAFPGGRHPAVEAVVEGCKVYDPRLDSTNGGSGSHRTNDPTSWGSGDNNNPALAAATYLIIRKLDGGWGLDPSLIDWDWVAAEADRCEDTIRVPKATGSPAYEDIPRYTVNLPLDTTQQKTQNLALICSTMMGHAFPVGAKIKVRGGGWDVPSLTIDETWLAGPVDNRRKVSINATYNAVRVLYRRADNDWKPDVCREQALVVDGSPEVDGGRRLLKEVNAEGVDNEYRAQYQAIVLLRMSRYQGNLVLACNAKALDVEPFEIVGVDLVLSPTKTIQGYFRVIDWTNWDGVSGTLVLQREAEEIWDVELGDFTLKSAPVLAAAGEPTPPVPVITGSGGIGDGFRIYIDPYQLAQDIQIEVHRGTADGGPYTYHAEFPAKDMVYVDHYNTVGPYYYKLRSRDARGNFSALTSQVGGYRLEGPINAAQAQVWVPGTAGDQGNYVAVGGATYNEVVTEPGPDGYPQPVWVGETLGVTGADSGFVQEDGLGVDEGFSHLDSYLYGVWFKRFDGPSGTIYFGTHYGSPAEVETLAGVDEINPYFVSLDMSYLDDDQWYLLVGVVYGSEYAGSDQGISGVYDPRTGEKLSAEDGAEFRWLVTATEARMRSFMYYSTTTDTVGRWASPFMRKLGIGEQVNIAAMFGRDTLTGLLRDDSDVQLGGAANGLQLYTSNTGSTLRRQSGSGSPLSATDAGATATISIAATYLYTGDHGTVPYNSGTITGLSFSTEYFVFVLDPLLAGGTVTYLASTNSYAPSQADGYVYFGKITTPADGGGGTGGSGGGGNECVAAETWIPGVGYAHAARPGAIALTMTDGLEFAPGVLCVAEPIVEGDLWVVETVGGARVVCSATTPVPIHDGTWRVPADLAGQAVHVLSGDGQKTRLDLVAVARPAGRGAVVPLHWGGRSFPGAAGPGLPAILTHNPEKP